MTNGNRAHTTMTPAKTPTKQTGWPPLPMTAKRTIAAKILPAWTRRFGSITLLDFIPPQPGCDLLLSKDLHGLCYSGAFRVSSDSSRVKGARMWQIAEARDKGKSASCSGGSGHLRGLRADGIRLIARVKQAGESNDNKF
jgi:hypothetical protein